MIILWVEQRMIIASDQFALNNFSSVVKLSADSQLVCQNEYIQDCPRSFLLRTNILVCDEGLINRYNPYREFRADAALVRILEGIKSKFHWFTPPLFVDGIRIQATASGNSIYGRFDISFPCTTLGIAKFTSLKYNIDVLLYWDVVREILLLFEVRDVAFLIISKFL